MDSSDEESSDHLIEDVRDLEGEWELHECISKLERALKDVCKDKGIPLLINWNDEMWYSLIHSTKK